MKAIPFLLILVAAIFSFWLGTAREKAKLHGLKVDVIKVEPKCPDSLAPLRDYQIELYNDTVWIFDRNRPVGRYISNWHNQIDTIILKDNE